MLKLATSLSLTCDCLLITAQKCTYGSASTQVSVPAPDPGWQTWHPTWRWRQREINVRAHNLLREADRRQRVSR